MVLHMSFGLPLYALGKCFLHGYFGIFEYPSYPLVFLYKEERGLPTSSSLLSYTCYALLALSLPPTKRVFRRAERLSGFRQELALDGEALPDS